MLQAYQKRCPFVIDCDHRPGRAAPGAGIMIQPGQGRLLGQRNQARPDRRAGEDFPVYTRKVHTDVPYLACARRLLAAPDADVPAVRDAQRAHPGDE